MPLALYPCSQSRLLFVGTQVLGQAFHGSARLPVGSHQGQVMCLDEVPSSKPTLVQHEHVMWTQHPRGSMGSRAKQLRKATQGSQGHPAYGQDKSFDVMGTPQAPTQDYPKLVKHFLSASMFCCAPSASWENLMDLQEEQNAVAVEIGLRLSKILLAQRIHRPGGLRDCILQDYALLEDSVQRDSHATWSMVCLVQAQM